MWCKIWMLRQWGNRGWVLNGSFWSDETYHWLHWMDCIVLLAECIVIWIVSYWLNHIVLYRLDHIISAGLDRIVSYRLDQNTDFYALAGYCLDGTDGTNGLYGELVGRGWDGPTLVPSGTGLPLWAPKQERHSWLLKGGGIWEVVAGTNCVGAARKRSICFGEAK